MTRKHYAMIADVLAGLRTAHSDSPDAVWAIDDVIDGLAYAFAGDNDRFDTVKFDQAARKALS